MSNSFEVGTMLQGTEIRSNITEICTLIEEIRGDLREDHLRVLQQTPFWVLFNAFISQKVKVSLEKNDKHIIQIIKAYTPSIEAFSFGEITFKLSPKDIQYIFGIRGGPQRIHHEHNDPKDCSKLLKRWFRSNKTLTTSNLKAAIKYFVQREQVEDVNDVARMMCLFLVGTLFFPSTDDFMLNRFVEYIEDLKKIRSYNWSNAIYLALKKSVEYNRDIVCQVWGCAITLLYWLCECTSKIGEENEETKSLPGFVKWDLQKLSNALNNTPLLSLQRDQKLIEEYKDGFSQDYMEMAEEQVRQEEEETPNKKKLERRVTRSMTKVEKRITRSMTRDEGTSHDIGTWQYTKEKMASLN